jgi:hypothetical protein
MGIIKLGAFDATSYQIRLSFAGYRSRTVVIVIAMSLPLDGQ